MVLFGLFTTPLWPTYIPSLIITPILMNVIARSKKFRTMPLSLLVGISFVIGAMVGPLVLIRMVLISLDEPKFATRWAVAGALAGAITLIVIVLVYRGTILRKSIKDKCV